MHSTSPEAPKCAGLRPPMVGGRRGEVGEALLDESLELLGAVAPGSGPLELATQRLLLAEVAKAEHLPHRPRAIHADPLLPWLVDTRTSRATMSGCESASSWATKPHRVAPSSWPCLLRGGRGGPPRRRRAPDEPLVAALPLASKVMVAKWRERVGSCSKNPHRPKPIPLIRTRRTAPPRARRALRRRSRWSTPARCYPRLTTRVAPRPMRTALSKYLTLGRCNSRICVVRI